LDRKQLKLKKHNGSIRGELYKGIEWNGAPNFEKLIPYDNNELLWNGFEYKHPEEEINWKNIYDFVNYVMNEPDDNFYPTYQSRFEINNLVDYFIFLNLLRAKDNTGKNIFVAKYKKNDPYFYSPWDLDGTFGTIWDGSLENRTDDIRSNRFYDRLWKDYSDSGFRARLSKRWSELRNTTIRQAGLMEMFQKNHDYLKKNGIYKKELIAFPECQMNEAYLNSDHLAYMSDWIANRLKFLDDNFILAGSGISAEETATVKIYPNPATDFIYINTGTLPAQTLQVRIYDVSGKLIKQTEFNDTENKTPQIPVHDMEKGIYFIQLSAGTICLSEKVVIN